MTQSVNEWLKTFSENLKYEMDARRYSQNQLARKCGISQGALSRYLRCERIPCLRDIMSICAEFDLTLDEMIVYDKFIV